MDKCEGHTGGPYPKADSNCMDLAANKVCFCTAAADRFFDDECYPTEDTHNNFIALRMRSIERDSVFMQYQSGNQGEADINFTTVDFEEYYDIDKDPWQMNNLAVQSPPELVEMRQRLQMWMSCAGSTCP
eukprot:1190096-Amphidinium_carterae.1